MACSPCPYTTDSWFFLIPARPQKYGTAYCLNGKCSCGTRRHAHDKQCNSSESLTDQLQLHVAAWSVDVHMLYKGQVSLASFYRWENGGEEQLCSLWGGMDVLPFYLLL